MSREGNRPEALDERQRSNTSVSAGLLIPPDTRQRDYKRVIRKEKRKRKKRKKKKKETGGKKASKRYIHDLFSLTIHADGFPTMRADDRSITKSNLADLPDFTRICQASGTPARFRSISFVRTLCNFNSSCISEYLKRLLHR